MFLGSAPSGRKKTFETLIKTELKTDSIKIGNL
ncbi:MAG: hypothetical protein ACJA1H_000316 [Glaciecola sp.]|jgi:hypothetical protein